MGFFRSLVIALGLFLVAQTTWATSTAGSTAGAFEVNANGAATYTLPIKVPQGISGVEPKLALVYNSQKGNGLLGVGWSLSGLSSIRRCAGSIAIEGGRSGIDFSVERFCLNGSRLLQVGAGTDPVDGDYQEYRTEIESFTRIKAFGADATDPDFFRTWSKGGEIKDFGNPGSPDNGSRLNPQGKGNFIWALNKLENRNGNYLSISYFNDPNAGEQYPVAINYTSNDGEGLVSNKSVTLSYESRSDVRIRYVVGAKLSTNSRLDTITTNFNTAVVSNYSLAYEQEATGSARSRLTAITECGSDLVCYSKPLSFVWRDHGGLQFVEDSSSLTHTDGETFSEWNKLIDMNGDGLVDLFRAASDNNANAEVLLNNGAGGYDIPVMTADVLTIPTTTGDGVSQWNDLADINGDGLVDIFQVTNTDTDINNGTAMIHFGRENGSFVSNYISSIGIVATE